MWCWPLSSPYALYRCSSIAKKRLATSIIQAVSHIFWKGYISISWPSLPLLSSLIYFIILSYFPLGTFISVLIFFLPLSSSLILGQLRNIFHAFSNCTYSQENSWWRPFSEKRHCYLQGCCFSPSLLVLTYVAYCCSVSFLPCQTGFFFIARRLPLKFIGSILIAISMIYQVNNMLYMRLYLLLLLKSCLFNCYFYSCSICNIFAIH